MKHKVTLVNKFYLKMITISVLTLLGRQSLDAVTTKDVFAKYPNEYFVESGGLFGDGVQMAIDAGFRKIYSIELKPSFHRHNCRRFASSPFVKLVLGDTTKMLPLVLKKIDAPATFWLDGHYSGAGTGKGKTNTPLLQELDHIGHHHIKTHTILIDDVRLFGTWEMDFITLDEVVEKVRSINPNYKFLFEDGYIPNDVLVAIVRNR